MKLTQRIRTRLSARTRVIIAGTFCLLLAVGLTFIINLSDKRSARAAIAGDYRTKASGDWSNPATWEKYNGSSWINATVAPTVADGTIEIQADHYITITTNITVDQLLVDENGMIAAIAGSVTIMNGAGIDAIVNGYWNIGAGVTFNNGANMSIAGYVFCQANGAVDLSAASTVTVDNFGVFEKDAGTITETAGHWIIKNGGSYRHNQDGGNIPFATWETGSNCEVTGALFTAPHNLSQPFWNFSWSCASQPFTLDFNGELTTVNGDFRMTSTGTGAVRLNTTGNNTITIGGNIYQDGGTIIVTGRGNVTLQVNGGVTMTDGLIILDDSTADAASSLWINKDLRLDAGTIDMSQYRGSVMNTGIGSVYVKGNLVNYGGILTASSTAGSHGNFHFANAGSQTIQGFASFGTGVNVFVDNGSILDLNTKILAGEGNFTLSPGAEVLIGHFNGLTTSASAGNVQMQGTRTYSSGANYTYIGTVSQLTGDGLPSVVNNLTINNSSGVILSNSVTVSHTLNLVSGNVNTATDTMKLGLSNAIPGTLVRTSTSCIVTGWFARWISSASPAGYVIPLGYDGNCRAANMTFTDAPTNAGYVTWHYTAMDPGESGLPVDDGDYKVGSAVRNGFWTFESNLTGCTYNIELYTEGFFTSSSAVNPRILYRETITSPWTMTGSYAATSLVQSMPVINRTGVAKASGQLAIGEASTVSSIADSPAEFNPSSVLFINDITPNPFFEDFSLHFVAALKSNATVTMMNTIGQTIVKDNMIADAGLNSWHFTENRNLVPGVYFLTVEMYGMRVTKRIIKYS